MKRIIIMMMVLALGGATARAQQTATTVENSIFTVVEQAPEFPDGMDAMAPWLGSHVSYPAEAKAQKLEGTVYVTFVVEKDGSISGVKVLNHREEMTCLEEEAVRLVRSMPKWKAGKQRGKKVRVQFTLPIQFQL